MFAGIGGFRAGLTRAGGFQCIGHCEIDKYADASYRAIPSGQRTDAVCRMICKGYQREDLLDGIRTVIREELHRVELVSAKEKNEQPQAGDVDDSVLGFLLGLQREGDDELSDSLF